MFSSNIDSVRCDRSCALDKILCYFFNFDQRSVILIAQLVVVNSAAITPCLARAIVDGSLHRATQRSGGIRLQ
jgi:hypothetical protein